MGLIIGGVPPHGLILDGQSASLYVGGSPPVKVWPTGPETVQITLGTGYQARDQFRAALTERGLSHQTITEVPFEIELVGAGSLAGMFWGCSALVSAPDLDTSSVTDMTFMFNGCSALVSAPDLDTSQVIWMSGMFWDCSALMSVPDMDTSSVADASSMFRNCAALTDGNVRLIGRHPNVDTTGMITGSGLTREPFYKADGTPDDGTIIEVHEVSVTDVRGVSTDHPLLTVTVPAGETWNVRIQGTITKATSISGRQPMVNIGGDTFGPYWQGDTVDCSGTVTSANSTIAIRTVVNSSGSQVSFVGTVTIEK